MDEEWRDSILKEMGDELDVVRRCLEGMPSREAVVNKLMRCTSRSDTDDPMETTFFKICKYLDNLRLHQGGESIKSTVITPCVKYGEFCERLATKIGVKKGDVANNISNNKILLPMGVVRRGYKKREADSKEEYKDPRKGLTTRMEMGVDRAKSIILELGDIRITIEIANPAEKGGDADVQQLTHELED